MLFSKLKPEAPINWLIAAAGFTWSAVGILLCKLAYGWLDTLIFSRALLSGAAGMIGAVVAYHFVFSAIALKNIDRISLFQNIADPEGIPCRALSDNRRRVVIIQPSLLRAAPALDLSPKAMKTIRLIIRVYDL